MKATITEYYVASALGRGKEETLANYRLGTAPGMNQISGDILGRTVFFGSVLGELPVIAESKWNTRTNRLIELALKNLDFARLIGRYGTDRVGVVIGASNTGIHEAQDFVDRWIESGRALPPEGFDFSMIELGTPSLYLRDRIGAKGPAYTISTACSSSAKAFGAARRLIEKGLCDAVVTGGVDGRCRFALNGFHALGALSEGRCRPLADDRDGINLGEGVALFAMEKSAASADVVKFIGIGESSDAYHATAPDPEGTGAETSMRGALHDAGLVPADVDYVNLHGTGTQANDAMEMKAFHRVFDALEKPPRFESTKSLTGHCLGAAGAVEAAIAAILIEAGMAKTALSNSFAFGGSNASIILSA